MAVGKTVKRVLIAAAITAVLVAGGVYVQASRIPSNYRPAQLTAEQRDRAAKEFLNKKVLHEFGNAAQMNEPFTWTATAEELNRYLAAMNEIASSAPSVEHDRLYRAMEEAGLAAPAVALEDGVLTLMIRWRDGRKIVSVDLAFEFTEAGDLRVDLAQTRVGMLALPDSWVQGRLDEFKAMIPAGDEADDEAGPLGFSSVDVGSVLGAVLAAVGREPISTEFTWRMNRKRIRIDSIDIDDGEIRLHVVPVGRASSATGRRDGKMPNRR